MRTSAAASRPARRLPTSTRQRSTRNWPRPRPAAIRSPRRSTSRSPPTDRYAALQKSDSVSQQEVDEKKSAYTQAQATLAAATANIQRLEQLESFKNIYAPFAGVITRRNVDVGTLVNAGNGGAAQQLFHLAQTDPMRCACVQVPEAAAPFDASAVSPRHSTSRSSRARCSPARSCGPSGSIDVSTRTLQTEVDVPNREGRLLPGRIRAGAFQVGAGGARRLQIPVNALLFRAEGLRAAVVDANHRIQLRALTIGRDFGTSLEVLQGLSPDDWVVINPPDSIENNQEVRVQTPGRRRLRPRRAGGKNR